MMIKVFALWRQKSKNGQEYLQGKLGDARVLVFENDKKEQENHPDFIVYFDSAKRGPGGENKGTAKDSHAPAKNDGYKYDDNDVPF